MMEKIPAMKHTARPWPARQALFIDVISGACLHEDGRSFGARGALSLARVLGAAGHPGWGTAGSPRVIYLVGGWNAASTPRSEWFEAPQGWTRTAYHRNPLIANYRHDLSGRRLTIYTTAQWFGQCPDISLCQKAYTRLRALLRASFDAGVSLMGTPARTGLDLLERSLPRDKEGHAYEYSVLADDLRERLEHNIGQGRMEMIRPVEGTPGHVHELYVMDAMWMYAGCSRSLPVGPVAYDRVNECAGYRPGFYHVAFRVPAGWSHIGLLPVWNPKQKRPVWPATPNGHEYHSYVGQDELRLAIDQGWSIQILERWLFASEHARGSDPARAWIEKLQAVRTACTDEKYGRIAPLLRAAVRALVLKAIGSLHRKGRYEQFETPVERADDIPEDAEIVWRDDQIWRWRKPISLDKSMQQYQHPEWAASVWSKARARLNRAALALPRETIVALRSDAIVTTINPNWPAAVRPGDFRLKEVLRLVPGQSLPRTSPEYLALRAANQVTENDEEGGE